MYSTDERSRMWMCVLECLGNVVVSDALFTRRTRSCFSFFFFSSRRRHTRCSRDWSSDVCSSDLLNDLVETAAEAIQFKGFGEVECRYRAPDDNTWGTHLLMFAPGLQELAESGQIGRASCRERV